MILYYNRRTRSGFVSETGTFYVLETKNKNTNLQNLNMLLKLNLIIQNSIEATDNTICNIIGILHKTVKR